MHLVTNLVTNLSQMLWKSRYKARPIFKVVRRWYELTLCKSMAYNVISCLQFAKNIQTLKIADFTM